MHLIRRSYCCEDVRYEREGDFRRYIMYVWIVVVISRWGRIDLLSMLNNMKSLEKLRNLP